MSSQTRKRRQFYNFPWATASNNHAWLYRPLVSVVLPVYNQADLLPKSVDSVLNEHSYPLELIVVDDGSSDDVASALANFTTDPRLTVLHEPHRGLSKALNKGFEATRGAFVTWTSADNQYLPGAIEKLSNYLLANPSVGLVYGNVELIDDNGNPLVNSPYRLQDQREVGSSELLLPVCGSYLAECRDNFINACFLYRREIRDFVGDYDQECLGYEDFEYWLRTSLCTTVAHIDTDEVLYQYRIHPNSLTAELNADSLAKQTIEISEHWHSHKQTFSSPLEITINNSKAQDSQISGLIAHCLRISGDNCAFGSSADNEKRLPQITEVCANSVSAYAFRPEAFPRSMRYLHSTHRELYGDWPAAPFVIAKEKPKHSATTGLIPGTCVLPPVTPPTILRMARDSYYQAVVPCENSLATVLVFCPDQIDFNGSNDECLRATESYNWSMSTLAHMINRLKNFTFVTLCNNSAQRRSADALNLSLNDNGNYRIIDITTKESMSVVDYRSMMLVLSSVDVVLSLSEELSDMSTALELRLEATLAALAGRAIVAITKKLPAPKKHCISGWLSSSDKQNDSNCGISELVLQMPHLGVFEWGKLPESQTENLEAQLSSFLDKASKAEIDQKSLEQWLQGVSLSAVGPRIHNVILAKEHRAV